MLTVLKKSAARDTAGKYVMKAKHSGFHKALQHARRTPTIGDGNLDNIPPGILPLG